MAIKIPFVADVSGFLRGTGDVVDSLEDVEDALDDLGRSRGADAAEQDLEDLGRAADASADRLERSFSHAFDTLQREGRTASRKVRADVDDVGHHGSATMQEFGQEARQNVAESLSSFTGSASSAVDAVQSTFGGLVSALGPAGLLGAGVIAAGIGLARGLFEKSQEEAERLAERVGAIFDEMRANAGAVSFDFTSSAIADLLKNKDDLKDLFGTDDIKQFNRELAELGLNGRQTSLMFRGLVGDQDDVAAAQEVVNEQQAKWMQLISDPTVIGTARGNAMRQLELLSKFETAYHDAGGAATTAAVEYHLLEKATTDTTAATDDAVSAGVAYVGISRDQAAAAADAAAAIQRKNDAMAEETAQNYAVETALLAYRDALDATSKTLKDNGRTHDVNTEKGRANRKALLELASAGRDYAAAAEADSGKVSSYNQAIEQQHDAFVDAARAAGYTATQAEKLATKYGLVPKVVKTNVTDDGTAAATQKRIDNIKSSGVPVPVTPDMSGVDRSIQNWFDGKVYRFTVAPRPGKSVGV